MKFSLKIFFLAVLAICVFITFVFLIVQSLNRLPKPQTLSVPSATSTAATKLESEYIEVTDSCGPYFESPCLRVHSEPTENSPIIWRLRNGMVFKVDSLIKGKNHLWYKIVFEEKLLYPDRIKTDLYVASDFVTPFHDIGIQKIKVVAKPTNQKRIVVVLSEQNLYAYDGDTLFKETKISTGLEPNLTATGTFNIFKKMPTRYMQGPLPNTGTSTKAYDLPGVPWDLYFTSEGAAIHGAYWHNSFGTPQSHGCVNVAPLVAKELYQWADLGTPVTVQE